MDSIADMITRIRNGQRVGKNTVSSPSSKLREAVLKVLLQEGYIRHYEVRAQDDGVKKVLQIELKYYNGAPVIQEIKKVSKPGRRVYAGARDVERVYGGLGVAILSTPRGVITDSDARSTNVGGEVLCRVF